MADCGALLLLCEWEKQGTGKEARGEWRGTRMRPGEEPRARRGGARSASRAHCPVAGVHAAAVGSDRVAAPTSGTHLSLGQVKAG
jgi:hypothetical protein